MSLALMRTLTPRALCESCSSKHNCFRMFLEYMGLAMREAFSGSGRVAKRKEFQALRPLTVRYAAAAISIRMASFSCSKLAWGQNYVESKI